MKLTIASVFPSRATTPVGARGRPVGVTEEDAAELLLDPIALVAFAVKVYAVPFVNPVTTNGELAPVEVNPPGDDVTV